MEGGETNKKAKWPLFLLSRLYVRPLSFYTCLEWITLIYWWLEDLSDLQGYHCNNSCHIGHDDFPCRSIDDDATQQ